MGNKDLLQKIGHFEGVYCSGFFIPDQAVVTALCLLFEKVHFLNQLEYAISVSETHSIRLPETPEITLTPTGKRPHDEPLKDLTDDQRLTVDTYLYLADRFFFRNALLFPDIFHCSLLPDSEVLSAKLIERGKPGELNTYQVTRNPLTVCTGGEDELTRLLDMGRVPIVGGLAPATRTNEPPPPTQLAAALAIKSIAMVLPCTKAAEANDILEAREKLRDQLPPFWSSMLKLSGELSERLDPQASEAALQRELDHAVDTLVRPALIDLVDKIEKERKQWFFKILSPVAQGLRVLAGKPPTDLASVVASTLTVGADASMDIATQLRKVDALKRDSGLTYLIELHNVMAGTR